MLKCNDLIEGKTYGCGSCGLEIKVTKPCTHNDTCDCASDDTCCDFSCCGEPMTIKD